MEQHKLLLENYRLQEALREREGELESLKSDMNDLLVCLGQETEKVEALERENQELHSVIEDHNRQAVRERAEVSVEAEVSAEAEVSVETLRRWHRESEELREVDPPPADPQPVLHSSTAYTEVPQADPQPGSYTGAGGNGSTCLTSEASAHEHEHEYEPNGGQESLAPAASGQVGGGTTAELSYPQPVAIAAGHQWDGWDYEYDRDQDIYENFDGGEEEEEEQGEQEVGKVKKKAF
uniref:Uncharacterized protein n=1 Tax=Chloropicon laureae TaxID=464258 RepID=A0A7S2YUD6_9CHLO